MSTFSLTQKNAEKNITELLSAIDTKVKSCDEVDFYKSDTNSSSTSRFI